MTGIANPLASVENTASSIAHDSSGQPAVLFDKRGDIAWITLNRPRQYNAYNVAMRDGLYEALWAVHHDPEVRAMVLTGAGPAFSTGGDLREFGQAPSPVMARWIRFRRDVWGLLRSLPIPTVAAVHGFTVGGGLEMLLLCDLAVAADDTRICLPETGTGMIPGVAGTQTASRRLGLGWALDLCITGRWIDPAQALCIGLVAEVVPAAQLERRALELAQELGRVPRPLAAIVKTAIWEGLELPIERALELERCLAEIVNAAGPNRGASRIRKGRFFPARQSGGGK